MQVDESGGPETETSQSEGASSNDSGTQGSEQGKYAPKESFEDGSVMYTAADLKAADYEAVLKQ